MAAFILGGPLANLAVAAATWQLWLQPLPTPVRVAAAFAAVIGVLVGVANLLPVRLTESTLDPDGLNALRWVLHPRISTASSTTDTAPLDKIIEKTDHPLVLLAAVIQRFRVDPAYDQIVPMAERLSAIAHDEHTKPKHAGIIASQLALLFGSSYLIRGIVEGNAIDRANADEINRNRRARSPAAPQGRGRPDRAGHRPAA